MFKSTAAVPSSALVVFFVRGLAASSTPPPTGQQWSEKDLQPLYVQCNFFILFYFIGWFCKAIFNYLNVLCFLYFLLLLLFLLKCLTLFHTVIIIIIIIIPAPI